MTPNCGYNQLPQEDSKVDDTWRGQQRTGIHNLTRGLWVNHNCSSALSRKEAEGSQDQDLGASFAGSDRVTTKKSPNMVPERLRLRSCSKAGITDTPPPISFKNLTPCPARKTDLKQGWVSIIQVASSTNKPSSARFVWLHGASGTWTSFDIIF